MKKQTIVLFFILAVTSFAFSQDLPVIEVLSERFIFDVKVNKMMGNGPEGKLLDLRKIKGSPYLNNEFVNGEVHQVSDDKHYGYKMRYNIYTDEIELLNSKDNSVVALLKDPDIVCHLGNQTYEYKEFTDNTNQVKKGYFVALLPGKSSLYLKYRSKYRKAQPADTPLSYDKPASFATYKDYYLLANGKMTLLSNKKSKFFTAFGTHQNKVKQFVKKNKLKIGNEKDLIKIINYYNSLL